jgi:glycosyltransferase involved in cell wall biosynthesis
VVTPDGNGQRPLRILLIIGSLQGGGAERVFAWLATDLSTRGHSVTLFTLRAPETDYYDVPEAVSRRVMEYRRFVDSSTISFFVNRFRYWRYLRSLARDEQPDVALSFMDSNNIAAATALIGVSLPLVVAERVHPAHSALGPIERIARPILYRRRATTIVAQTSGIAEWMSAQWGVVNTAVVPNAVIDGPHRWRPMPDREPQVLAVGRLDHQKAHDVLLRAWAKVQPSAPTWTLRIAGEGPEQADLFRLRDELQLRDSVVFEGRSNRVVDMYQSASVFVLPSRFEGFPNALVEAMANGCAVIASDCPGASSELVTDGVDGLMVSVDSIDELAAALRRLIESARLRQELSEAAKSVWQRYTPVSVGDKWEDILYSAAQHRGALAPTVATSEGM